MKRQTLVTAKREQDGRFALLLESEDAVQRDLRREALRQRRMEQLRQRRMEQLRQAEENQSLLAGGIDPAEVFA